MQAEVFRARNVCVMAEQRVVLQNFNMTLYCGEIVGLHSLFSLGENAVLDLIGSRISPSSGAVFFHGEKPENTGTMQPRVMLLSRGDSFVNDLSLWENMLVLRENVPAWNLLSVGAVRRSFHVLLKEYGLELLPDMPMRQVPPALRFMLKLIRAKLEKAQIVLVSNFTLKANAWEEEQICRLMQRLAGEGMTILIASHRLDLLRRYVGRLAFLSNGTILKIADLSAPDDGLIGRMMDSLATGGEIPAPERTGEGKDTTVCTLPLHELGLSQPFSLELHQGEIVELLDSSEAAVQYVNSYAAKNDIPCISSPLANTVIQELSVAENLYLGMSRKFSTQGVIRTGSVEFLLREFARWYGSDDILGQKNCLSLERNEKIAIALFRLYIQQPKILMFTGVQKELDYVSHKLLVKTILALAEEGCALCFADESRGEYELPADRSFVVSGRRALPVRRRKTDHSAKEGVKRS